MTTEVTVKVPEGASYVARVTITQTANNHVRDVQPGNSQTFYASSGCSVHVAEAPIAPTESRPPATSEDVGQDSASA